MGNAIIVISGLLWLWFLGCTFTWKFGKVLLVEGMGLKSIEFTALVLFTIGFGCFLLWEPVGKWILLVVLTLWLVALFLSLALCLLLRLCVFRLKG